jgi:hypothetical protein
MKFVGGAGDVPNEYTRKVTSLTLEEILHNW